MRLPTSVLIANRGEIACRIIRTCRRLGIKTVAVFSDTDADARHVALADTAVRLGPGPAAESYLEGGRVVEAARRTGAQAIHPGYGFLAENPRFARAVRDAGLVFIGPTPEAMERLGDKDRAKALAAEAGVAAVPGWQGPAQDDATLAAAAAGVGFPLLIKAVAGGGGRGMRRVAAAEAFAAALAACRREAQAAFGRDAVLLERLIERPRHIEVQVFGDARGGVVHLFERDCTLQRRHQKIVEEAPAAGLEAATREAMAAAAVRLAAAAGYTNAGTVEFLVAPDGRFWFIEMNTRLQVEHPVTEAVTGQDLVEWQLLIAFGAGLPLRQEELRCAGHAVEVRLCAEDPAQGFLPSIGRLDRFRLPGPAPGLRIESGVVEGDSVSPHYDSMIAKVIAHGPDRDAALERLAAALAEIEVEGPTTNLALLEAVLDAPPFRAARIDTTWLDREPPALDPPAAGEAEHLLAALAMLQEIDALAGPGSPWERRGGWRLNAAPRRVVRFTAPALEIEAVGAGDGLVLHQPPRSWTVRHGQDDSGPWATIDGHRRRFAAHRHDGALILRHGGRRFRFLVDGPTLAAAETAGEAAVRATMPGRVTAILVAAGEAVRTGQKLLVLEAMKMEHVLTAPHAGHVAVLRAAVGEQVDAGAVLVEIAAAEAEP